MERFEQIVSTVYCFDEFETRCREEYDKECGSLAEMRLRDNKKIRGDIFECFALRYMKCIYKYKNSKGDKVEGLKEVWLLKDLPNDLREKLNMEKVDLGIDLVGVDDENNYYAIQVKFRTPNPYKSSNGIGWKQLSTFYGLVNKTGPWIKHVVFTNANYVRHVGQKTSKDLSICRTKLLQLKHMDFLKLNENQGYKSGYSREITEEIEEVNEKEEIKFKPRKTINRIRTGRKKTKEPTLEELRTIRANFFNNQ